MLRSFAKIAALTALSLSIGATAANAGCEGKKTTGTVVGGATGGIVGAAVTHGSPIGIIGGAVVGGLAGHTIASSNCRSHYYHRRYYYHNGHRGYYDHDHHWHYYTH